MMTLKNAEQSNPTEKHKQLPVIVYGNMCQKFSSSEGLHNKMLLILRGSSSSLTSNCCSTKHSGY